MQTAEGYVNLFKHSESGNHLIEYWALSKQQSVKQQQS